MCIKNTKKNDRKRKKVLVTNSIHDTEDMWPNP